MLGDQKQFRSFRNKRILLSKPEQEACKDIPRKFDYKAYFKNKEDK